MVKVRGDSGLIPAWTNGNGGFEEGEIYFQELPIQCTIAHNTFQLEEPRDTGSTLMRNLIRKWMLSKSTKMSTQLYNKWIFVEPVWEDILSYQKKNLSQEGILSVVVVYLLKFLFSKTRHILINVIKMEGTLIKLHHDYILSDFSHFLSFDKYTSVPWLIILALL